MKTAPLKVIPEKCAITQTEIRKQVVEHLPKAVLPGGGKSDWRSKSVQLEPLPEARWSCHP